MELPEIFLHILYSLTAFTTLTFIISYISFRLRNKTIIELPKKEIIMPKRQKTITEIYRQKPRFIVVNKTL